MARALRRTRVRSVAALLTLSAMLALTLSMGAHDDSDDRWCAGGAVAGGSGPMGLSADAVPRHADHCALCHAARNVRTAIATSQPLPPAHALRHAGIGVIVLAAAVRGTGRPARAPPRA